MTPSDLAAHRASALAELARTQHSHTLLSAFGNADAWEAVMSQQRAAHDAYRSVRAAHETALSTGGNP